MISREGRGSRRGSGGPGGGEGVGCQARTGRIEGQNGAERMDKPLLCRVNLMNNRYLRGGARRRGTEKGTRPGKRGAIRAFWQASGSKLTWIDRAADALTDHDFTPCEKGPRHADREPFLSLFPSINHKAGIKDSERQVFYV